MRTIGFRSNILFAIAAAFGVVASLGRPWYGPSPSATDAEMEDFFSGVGRAFSESEGTTGWVALQSADQLIVVLTLGTVALLILALIPELRYRVQVLAQWSALATLGVVLVKLIDGPASASTGELRHGIFIAVGASGVLVASAMTVAVAPTRRRTPARVYTPPPAPEYDRDATSWGPPQF